MYELKDSRFLIIDGQSLAVTQPLLLYIAICIGIVLLIIASFVFFKIRKGK